MLLKTNISNIKVLSDEWRMSRLAKLTSSKISCICGEKGLGLGGINYVRDKVGEELTGKSSEKEFDNDAVRHGIFYEATATNKFGLKMGLDFIVTQQLVFAPNSRFGCTPDGLIPLNETPDGLAWNVETVEVKCPPTFNVYISLFECENPQDVKKTKPEWFWQVMDQLMVCGAMKGYLVIYHPDFRSGNMKVIEFDRRVPTVDEKGKLRYLLNEDYKLLEDRKRLAEEKFDEIRNKLLKSAKV